MWIKRSELSMTLCSEGGENEKRVMMYFKPLKTVCTGSVA